LRVDLFFSAPIVFILLTIIIYLSYLFGKRFSFKHSHTDMELDPYACGEGPDRFPPEKIQMNTKLYKFAIYFTIFDVAAFILAVSVKAQIFLLILYSLILASALVMLPKR